MSAIVWPLSRDPWKDLTNSHTVANTVWGTNSDLHLLPGLKPPPRWAGDSPSRVPITMSATSDVAGRTELRSAWAMIENRSLMNRLATRQRSS